MLFIDLTMPGTRIISTRPEERKQRTSTWAKKKGVQIAINGAFFSYKKHPTFGQGYFTWGTAMGDGQIWKDIVHLTAFSAFAVPAIVRAPRNPTNPSLIRFIVSSLFA